MPTVNHANGFILDDFSGGVLDGLSVSDSLMPKNAVRKGVNCMFDRPRGAVSQRYGTTKVGGTVSAGKPILGLFNHRVSTTSYNKLLAACYGDVYYLNGAIWTSLSQTWDSTAKVRFVTYLDSTAMMNGTDSSRSWTGTGAVTTTGGNLDVGSMPKGKFGTVLNGRMFVALGSTLYASSIVSSSTISWTSGNKSVGIFPNDGSGDLTGIAGNGKVILLFKERAMYRYDDNSLDRIVNIGTSSHESIVTDDNGITYFFGTGTSGVGFYMSAGGYPKKISRPVQGWVEAISASSYANIAAYTDSRKIVWYVGSVTMDGTAYTNACLVYNIADQTWEQRNYADAFRVFSQYVDTSGNLTVVGGDTDGMVQTMDSGTTDNSSPIVSECEFGPVVFTSRTRMKKVEEAWTLATHFQGLHFLLRVDDGPYVSVGTINDGVKDFSALSRRGHVFHPKITAVNSGTPFQFDGFDFAEWGDEGYSG